MSFSESKNGAEQRVKNAVEAAVASKVIELDWLQIQQRSAELMDAWPRTYEAWRYCACLVRSDCDSQESAECLKGNCELFVPA